MATLSTQQPARHTSPVAKAIGLAYLVFERPDLERAKEFLVDFGLRVAEETDDCLFMRGTGDAPFMYRVDRGPRARFVGPAFEVDDYAALEALSELPGASAVQEEEGPGGGARVLLVDPSGFRVAALYGRRSATPLAATHCRSTDLTRFGASTRGTGRQRCPPRLCGSGT